MRVSASNLLYMSAGCDVSTQVYNAQKMGAIVVIVIHTTDNRDSVELPKQGANQVRYADASKIRIPCFTVRKGIGEKLTTMLPSIVGIQRPKTTVNNPQAFAVPNIAAEQAKRDSIYKAEKAQYDALHPSVWTGKGWVISPNPASDEVVIQYNFEREATVNIEIFNESGQVLATYELPKVQTGKLVLDVTNWQTGLYNVSLRSGSLKQVKRLVVAR